MTYTVYDQGLNRHDEHVHNVVFSYRGYVISLRNDTPSEMLIWRKGEEMGTSIDRYSPTPEGIVGAVRAIDRLEKKRNTSHVR